jgi:hypothetical protein
MHPVPPVISRINRDMAAFFATLTMLRGAPMADGHPVILRNASAVKLLNDIATDKVTLTLGGALQEDQQEEISAGGATVVNPAYDGSMFTPGEFGIFPNIREGFQLGHPYPEDTY